MNIILNKDHQFHDIYLKNIMKYATYDYDTLRISTPYNENKLKLIADYYSNPEHNKPAGKPRPIFIAVKDYITNDKIIHFDVRSPFTFKQLQIRKGPYGLFYSVKRSWTDYGRFDNSLREGAENYTYPLKYIKDIDPHLLIFNEQYLNEFLKENPR